MAGLTEHGTRLRDDLSQRYGVSPTAVQMLMEAVVRGGGTQAQFDVPELGGMGQWSSGGMTMVGDMFNTGLQATVAGLCGEISNAAMQGALYERATAPRHWQGQQQSQGIGQGIGGQGMGLGFSSGWWPEQLGQPASQGSQNNLSYAIFPDRQRLAVNMAGRVTVHDTGAHVIGGISQQQGSGTSWTFTSQYGPVDLSRMPVVYEEDAQDEVPGATEAEVALDPVEATDAPAAAAVEDVTEAPEAVEADPVEAEAAAEAGWDPTPLEPPVKTARAKEAAEPAEGTEEDSDAEDAFAAAPVTAPVQSPVQSHQQQARRAESGAPFAEPPAAAPAQDSALYSRARVLNTPEEIYTALEKLGDLHGINVLTDEEFAAKKAELLARL
jgi:hypothetical protein